jgi:hypothetical protein
MASVNMWNKIPRKPQVTTASGSPVPNFLTQSTRQSVVSPVQRNQLQRLPSGIRYAYSGSYGSGAEAAVSVTLLDIGDSGDVDLLCQLSYSVDYHAVAGHDKYVGFSLTVNGAEIMFTKSSNTQDIKTLADVYDFILPAHSSLTVLGLSETTTVNRIASLIGTPI